MPKSTGSEDKADDKDELCECDIENGFLFVPSKGECIQPYDTGCDPSCEFCVGPSPNSCTECRANFGAAVIEKSPDSNFFSC